MIYEYTTHCFIDRRREKIRRLVRKDCAPCGIHLLPGRKWFRSTPIIGKSIVQVEMSNVDLPDMDFTDFVKTAKAKKPYIKVILLTTHGSIHEAIRAFKSGVFEYLTKGADNDVPFPLLAGASENACIHYESSII